MIDFKKYVGKPVILVTNFTDDISKIYGIRTERLHLCSFKNQWAIVRDLTEKDLKDEDFVDWLNNMWPDEKKLKLFLRYHKRT